MPTTLKEYAKEAKARMKSGFWKEIVEQRNKDVNNAIQQGKSPDVVLQEYREALFRKIYGTESKEDEVLYAKVCNILSKNEVVINPIGLLADKDKMKDMDESARQHYILQLSAKFKEMKERYYKEKDLSFMGKKGV